MTVLAQAGTMTRGEDLRMSEAQFVRWASEDVRAEWVDGKVVVMAPVSGEHDQLGGWLRSVLSIYVEQRDLGIVGGPEFMVRLPKLRQRRLPDIFFISKARQAIIGSDYVEGAPDLIMEVVSAESAARDWREKYLDYERAGVGEYWVIDPLSQRVEAYRLGKAKKYKRLAEVDGRIASSVLPGSFLRTEWLFGTRRAKIMAAVQELVQQ